MPCSEKCLKGIWKKNIFLVTVSVRRSHKKLGKFYLYGCVSTAIAATAAALACGNGDVVAARRHWHAAMAVLLQRCGGVVGAGFVATAAALVCGNGGISAAIAAALVQGLRRW